MGEEFRSKWHRSMLARFGGDDVALANFMRESAAKANHKNHRGGFNALQEKSPEQFREIARQAGIKSGEARRKKSGIVKKEEPPKVEQPTIKTPITTQAEAIEAIEEGS